MEEKNTNVCLEIEKDLKEQAEKVLSTLGISTSSAVSLFLKQVVLQGGIPFDIKIPADKLNDTVDLATIDLTKKMEQAEDKGNVKKPVRNTFSNIRKDYVM